MPNQQPVTGPAQSQAVNPNQQPKARFQADATRVRLHRNMVDLPEFAAGSDFAMLQFTGYLATQIQDSNSAMAAGYQLLGAFGYVATLKGLAETPKVPTVVQTGNLDHSRQ